MIRKNICLNVLLFISQSIINLISIGLGNKSIEVCYYLFRTSNICCVTYFYVHHLVEMRVYVFSCYCVNLLFVSFTVGRVGGSTKEPFRFGSVKAIALR